MAKLNTLIEVLKNNAESERNAGITFITGECDETFISYKELYEKALGVLYNLKNMGIKQGCEIVFQIEDSYAFVILFWACILGKIIPIPVSVGNNDEHKMKVFKIWNKLNQPYFAASKNVFARMKEFSNKNDLHTDFNSISSHTLFIEDIVITTALGEIEEAKSDELVFVQFSSGSTGDPKGVALTHENILSNVSASYKCAKFESSDKMLSWMPLTHDMGLIGFHILPLVFNLSQYIMPTNLFIRRPTIWLKKANEHRISVLSSPNFGYKYFLSFFKPEAAQGWDLSCVRILFNGAEPICVDLCNEFLDTMQRYNLKRSSMLTVYGLAEASVAAAFPPAGEEFSSVAIDRCNMDVGKRVKELPDNSDGAITFVDVGYSVDNCQIRIADDENVELGEKVIGYIQIKGKNVTSGYYNDEEITKKVLSKDGWLNTGDLGFKRNGRLVITGRTKDIIFINGQNVYPHDIERIVEKVEGVELGEIAACGIFDTRIQTEEIFIFVLFKKKLEDFVQLAQKIKIHIHYTMGLNVSEVLPIRKMPKTTSGKIQRYKLAEEYRNGEFESVIQEIDILTKKINNENINGKPYSEPNIFEGIMIVQILEIMKEELGVKNLDIDENLASIKMDSLKLVRIHARIDQLIPNKVALADFYTYPTIRKLMNHMMKTINNNIKYTEIKIEGKLTELIKAKSQVHGINGEDILYAIYIYILMYSRNVSQLHIQMITADEKIEYAFITIEGIRNEDELYCVISRQIMLLSCKISAMRCDNIVFKCKIDRSDWSIYFSFPNEYNDEKIRYFVDHYNKALQRI